MEEGTIRGSEVVRSNPACCKAVREPFVLVFEYRFYLYCLFICKLHNLCVTTKGYQKLVITRLAVETELHIILLLAGYPFKNFIPVKTIIRSLRSLSCHNR